MNTLRNAKPASLVHTSVKQVAAEEMEARWGSNNLLLNSAPGTEHPHWAGRCTDAHARHNCRSFVSPTSLPALSASATRSNGQAPRRLGARHLTRLLLQRPAWRPSPTKPLPGAAPKAGRSMACMYGSRCLDVSPCPQPDSIVNRRQGDPATCTCVRGAGRGACGAPARARRRDRYSR